MIRLAVPADADEMYDVCLRTGESGGDATPFVEDRRLLGHVYVGPYLELQPDLAFVFADEAGIAGYVLGALDTHAFEAACEESWWPRLRKQYPKPPRTSVRSRDAELVRMIHHPILTPGGLAERYPSHLHIDLLPRAQGRGQGRALMDTLLEALMAQASPAVHLGVNPANTKAIGFYRRLGFAELDVDGPGLMMGRHAVRRHWHTATKGGTSVIKTIEDMPPGTLGFEAIGTVTEDDYRAVLGPAIAEAFKAKDVRLLYVLDDRFDSYSGSAMWADTKLWFEHLTGWQKVAVVTNHDWIRNGIKAFGWLMPGEVRTYDTAEVDGAKAWLAEPVVG